jgi:hypothetical protein
MRTRIPLALGWHGGVILALISLTGCQNAPGPGSPGVPPPPAPSSPGLFRNIAAVAGIDFKHDAGLSGQFQFIETTPGGCALLDYDQDGRLDAFLAQSGPIPGASASRPRPTCRLYRNETEGGEVRFRDVTAEAGLDRDFGYLQGVAAADYNNDGYPDLYLTAYGGNRLLKSVAGAASGSRRFLDVTAEAGVGDTDQGPRWATSAAWGDYDYDGWLDLYVCHYVVWTPKTDRVCVNRAGQRAYCTPTQYEPDVGRLYRNLGNGRFQDVSLQTGIQAKRGRGLGAVWLDYDLDGRLDLYVANDLNPNLLFHNRGGRFEETGVEAGAAYGEEGEALSGMGIAVGDYSGDGREDLYVTNFSGQTNSLFRSEHHSLFTHSTRAAGLAAPTYHRLAWGVAFADLDRDGWQDLFVGNGHVNPDIEQINLGVGYEQPKGVYRNRGDGTFEDLSAQAGDATRVTVTRGLAAGDINNDGKLDFLACNLDRPAELLLNASSDAHRFLTLRLVGAKTNRDGIGARVRVTAGGRTQTAFCRTSYSYCASSDPRLHFGLGTAQTVDSIEIRWLGGATQTIRLVEGRPIPTNAFLIITEGKGAARDARIR